MEYDHSKAQRKEDYLRQERRQNFAFIEGSRANLCFMQTNIQLDPQVINAVTSSSRNTQSDENKLRRLNYDDFHNKFGHHGNANLQSLAKKLGYDLTEKCQTVMPVI